MGWRMLLRTRTERRLYQDYTVFQNKGRKTDPRHLQKSKIIWKQNTVGAAPQTWGPRCSFWPVSAANSAKQWATTWRWNERFRTDGSNSDRQRGRVFVSSCLRLSRCFPLTDRVLGAIKCVQSLQCEAGTLWSERIRCDFLTSLSELSKPPC